MDQDIGGLGDLPFHLLPLEMQFQIFGECMILIISYLKIKDKIIGKKNAKTIQQVHIAKFTRQNKFKIFKRPFLGSFLLCRRYF